MSAPAADKILRSRRWLLLASLAVTSVDLVFFILAPSFGYPLEYPQNLRVMQLVLPVTLGYLGAMTHFVFQRHSPRVTLSAQVLPFVDLLVRGPIAIFALATTAAIVAFGWSNRAAAPPGRGMSVDALSLTITASLGLLTVTTNAIVAYLFQAPAPVPVRDGAERTG